MSGGILLITNADGSDVQAVSELQSHSVRGADLTLQTVAFAGPPVYQAAVYYAEVTHVLMPLSDESFVDLQTDVGDPLDLIAAQLNVPLSQFDKTHLAAREDESVTLEIDASNVRFGDVLKQWEHRQDQRVVIVPVDVSTGFSGILTEEPQMVDLSVTYPNMENRDQLRTHHLAFALLIAPLQRKAGEIAATVPAALLIAKEDESDVLLAAERGLLQIGLQTDVTAVPSAPVIDRDQLREELLELSEDPDRAELIRAYRHSPGGGFG